MIEQDAAYLDTKGRATGFTRMNISNIMIGKPLFEQAHLCAFACSVESFK
jgi:hypothetical protein